jgi:hypothetical protein
MSGLTNQYVEELGKQILGKHFLGTFPCDIQPIVDKKKIFSLVFNLSKHDSKGSHFIAIFADENNLLYFDPLGHKCENADILHFMTKVRSKRKMRTKFQKIQDCNSIFCGFFCIAFLLSRHKNESLTNFFKHFSKQKLIKNDVLVIKYILNKINRN